MPMPWVKIYGDILDDVKLSRISDEQKWRYIQLILLASECDAGGALVINDSLMTVKDVSWRLRVDTNILQSDIEKLIEIGVIEMVEGVICVTKFMDRQGPTQEEKRAKWREYQERRREKAKTKKNVINVINDSTPKIKNKTQDIDKELDKDINNAPDGAASIPPQIEKSNKNSELSFNTPGARMLEAKLRVEKQAKGFKMPKGFPSIACRNKWNDTEKRLQYSQLADAVTRALEKNITDVTGIVDFIHGWNPNGPPGKNGKVVYDDSEESRKRYVTGKFSDMIEH